MSQSIFDFPFASGAYDVQIVARSFVNGRISNGNGIEVLQQQKLIEEARMKRNTNKQGTTIMTTMNNNNNNPLLQNMVSHTVTALEIPTGCGKTAIALSSAFHAQNVVAHQNRILARSAEVKAQRKKIMAAHRRQQQKDQKKTYTEEERKLLENSYLQIDEDDDDGDDLDVDKNNNNANNNDLPPPLDDNDDDEALLLDPDNDTDSILVSWQDPGRDFVLSMNKKNASATADGAEQFGNLNPSEEAKHMNMMKKKAMNNQQSSDRGNPFRDVPQLPHEVPRIIFLSRTHSQIKEVTRELRRFTESKQGGLSDLVSTCVMASRREYCIHAGARVGQNISGGIGDNNTSYQSGNVTGEMCDKLVKGGGCSMQTKVGDLVKNIVYRGGVVPASDEKLALTSRHMGTQLSSNVNSRSKGLRINYNKASPVWDIEDLCTQGLEMKGCPYYASRDLIQSQRCTFAPYNYLLDPVIRHETKIEKCIKGSIIVIDEAHNIADTLQESFSFQFPDVAVEYCLSTELAGRKIIDDDPARRQAGGNNNNGNHRQTVFMTVYNEVTKKYETKIDDRPDNQEFTNKMIAGDENTSFALTYPKNFRVRGAYAMSEVFELTYKITHIVYRLQRENISKRPESLPYGRDPTLNGLLFMSLLHQYYISSDKWGNDIKTHYNNNNNNNNNNNFVSSPDQLDEHLRSTLPSPFGPSPPSRDAKRRRNTDLNCKNRIVGNYELSSDDPAYILDVICSCWMTFGVTFNPFDFSSRSIGIFKTLFLGLLTLVKFPSSYCVYSEKAVFPGGQNMNQQQQQQQQEPKQLHLRCLDPSIGWRHLRRTARHIVLMSGTLGNHEILSKQLGEKFDLLTHQPSTRNPNAVDMTSFFYQNNNTNNSSNSANTNNNNNNNNAVPRLLTLDDIQGKEDINEFFDQHRMDGSTAQHQNNHPDAAGGEYNNDDDDEFNKIKNRKSDVEIKLPDRQNIINGTKHVHDIQTLVSKNFFRGSHVVDPSTQARAVIVTHLENGLKCECTYQQRSKPGFMESLARTVAHLINSIPHGSLVFCPSYAFLKDLFFKVRETKLIDFRRKTLYLETAGNSGGGGNSNNNNTDQKSFLDTMEKYRRDGENKSSCLMCVYRGKVSEGINLPDNLSRGVICVGIPLRMTTEPSVCAQRTYMSGSNWYSNDALVAVNQAIGRALRHKRDYGAIILLDARYANTNANPPTLSHDYGNLLPGWLKPFVRIATNNGVGATTTKENNMIHRLAGQLREFFEERRNHDLNMKATDGIDAKDFGDDDDGSGDFDDNNNDDDEEVGYSSLYQTDENRSRRGNRKPHAPRNRANRNNVKSEEEEEAIPFQKFMTARRRDRYVDMKQEADAGLKDVAAAALESWTGETDNIASVKLKDEEAVKQEAKPQHTLSQEEREKKKLSAGQNALAMMMKNSASSTSTSTSSPSSSLMKNKLNNTNSSPTTIPRPTGMALSNAGKATLWRPGMLNSIDKKKKEEAEKRRQEELQRQAQQQYQSAGQVKDNLFSGFKKASQIDIDAQKQQQEEALRSELSRHELLMRSNQNNEQQQQQQVSFSSTISDSETVVHRPTTNGVSSSSQPRTTTTANNINNNQTSSSSIGSMTTTATYQSSQSSSTRRGDVEVVEISDDD